VLRRAIALKVLPPGHLSEPESKERLTREARAASALNHPNIITIHDISSENGVDFIAMELIEGQPLSGLIPACGLPRRKHLAMRCSGIRAGTPEEIAPALRDALGRSEVSVIHVPVVGGNPG